MLPEIRYMCCQHCDPYCTMMDEHTFPCIYDCLPYTRQEKEELEMSGPMSSEPGFPENIGDIPANPAAEALTEQLEFERDQWETERNQLTFRLKRATDAVSRLDDFVLESVVNFSQALGATEETNDLEPMKHYLAMFINAIPTPAKMELEEEVVHIAKALAESTVQANAFGNYLEKIGDDPHMILEEAEQANQDFISTILGGLAAPPPCDESDCPVHGDDT